MNFKYLVSVDWLQGQINHPDLVILDATMQHQPNREAIPIPERVIPGSLAFNPRL